MLVSGRHKSQLRETGRLLGCVNYVAELGTEIVYDLGTDVVMNLGGLELTRDSVYETILDTGVVDLLLESYPRRLEMHTPWSDERDCTPLMRGNIDLDEVHKLLEANGHSQFELVDNGVIPRKSPTLDVPVTRAYHLVPRGVSKDQAVRKDQEVRGVPRGATVAVGDATADLPFAAASWARSKPHSTTTRTSLAPSKKPRTSSLPRARWAMDGRRLWRRYSRSSRTNALGAEAWHQGPAIRLGGRRESVQTLGYILEVISSFDVILPSGGQGLYPVERPAYSTRYSTDGVGIAAGVDRRDHGLL